VNRSGNLTAIAVLLLALAACGSLAPPPRTTVNVIGDKFSKAIELQGVPAGNSFDDNGVDWYLRSFVDPQSRSTAHQIYVEWFFPGHGTTKYFAADDRARDLPTRQLLKESCGRNCGQTDTVAIDVDEATLRARATTGFQVKLRGNDGSAVILGITPQMIAAQIQAEDRILNPPAGVSTTAAVASANARTPDGKPFLGGAPMDMPFGLGVVLARVDRNTPAEAAGLKESDTVLSYNGYPIDKAQQLVDQILLTKPGSVVPVEVARGGNRNNKVTLSVQM
jgi:hypothetical protein